MEQETMLKEILNALKAHGEQIDQRFEQLETEMKEGFEQLESEMKEGFKRVDRRFEQVDEQLEHLGKKSNGLRADFYETQENVNYLLSKNAQHKENLTNQASKGEGLS